MAVTKIIELVGSSPTSSDEAVQAALSEAQSSLRNIKAVDVCRPGCAATTSTSGAPWCASRSSSSASASRRRTHPERVGTPRAFGVPRLEFRTPYPQPVNVTCSGPSLVIASLAAQVTPARDASIVTALRLVASITSSSAFG